MSDNSFSSYLPKSSRRKKKRQNSRPVPINSFLTSLKPQISNKSRQVKKLPDKITVDFEEFNIFYIDRKIKDNIKEKISSVDDLKNDLTKMLNMINSTKDPVSKTLGLHEVNILRRRIQDLESTFELNLYIYRTIDLIEEYRKILSQETYSFVITNESQTKDANRVKNKKRDVLSRYLLIAQEYINLVNYQQKYQQMLCDNCGNTNFILDNDDSIYICTDCGTAIEILDDTPSYKDTDRVNMSSRYTYSKRGHFIHAIKCFQGIQNTDPKRIENIVQVLLKEINIHNLTRETVNKDHIYMFLNEKDLSKHYEDLNLLHHIITGENCPDISMYENSLLELFDKQEEAYTKVELPDRINALNVNYKLYKLLQKLNYPIRKDDFYILKTKNKEIEHDEKMKEAWELLGWNWIETY